MTDQEIIKKVNKILDQMKEHFVGADHNADFKEGISRSEYFEQHQELDDDNAKLNFIFGTKAEEITKQKIPFRVMGCTGRARLFSYYARQMGLNDFAVVLTVKTEDIVNYAKGKLHGQISGHQVIAVKLKGCSRPDNWYLIDPGKIDADPKKSSNMQETHINSDCVVDSNITYSTPHTIAAILTPDEYDKIDSYEKIKSKYLSCNTAKNIQSLAAILYAGEHPKHRDSGDKKEILFNRTNDKEKYPKLDAKSTENERIFAISGKDVYESGHQWSCGTVARTFWYINSELQKITNRSDLNPFEDVRIMLSVHPDHEIDGSYGHTLPCIKMPDGKWHAIEPNPNTIKNYPQHPQYPRLPIILDEIKVGNKVHHILPGMDVPYEITAFMSYQEYIEKCSSFGSFLKFYTKRDKKTKIQIGEIESILAQINSNGNTGNTYEFCKHMQGKRLPITIIKPKKHDFVFIALKIGNDLYYFRPEHKYAYLHKLQDLGNNQLLDIDSKRQYEIELTGSPSEYIQYHKGQIQYNPANGRE